jgi:hypothetical protein
VLRNAISINDYGKLEVPSRRSVLQSSTAQHRRINSAFCAAILIPLIVWCAPVFGRAPANRISLTLLPESQIIRVSGELAAPSTRWVFRDNYARLTGLSARIHNLALTDATGGIVKLTTTAVGEFRSEMPATRFVYDVDATPPAIPENAVFASWLYDKTGLLLLGDLLPLSARANETDSPGLELSVTLPAGWSVVSTEENRSPGQYHEGSSHSAGINTRVCMSGAWSFADNDLFALVTNILSEHAKTLDPTLVGHAAVILLPFPVAQSPQRWSSETRGHSVVLLSGRQSSRAAGLAQLGVSLTHELMHLWIPNALKLAGNYDWFYEGFTLYQALRTGMELGIFSFQDYLNAMAKAFDAYHAEAGRDISALVSLGEKRWQGSDKLLYNKGMLVAFLYDLNLRAASGGKQSLDSAYRFLLRGVAGKSGLDGNVVATQALSASTLMREFVNRYVQSPVSIDLESAIEPFGLSADRGPVRTRISVSDKLDGRQKALLKKLGYTTLVR